MERANPESLRADLAHGHSRIIWLMDELDAHLEGLASDPTGAEFIVEAFQAYWTQFSDDLREHIREEEQDLFPLVRLHATDSDLSGLQGLQDEHARLIGDLDAFDVIADSFFAAPKGQNVSLVAKLQNLMESIRVHLVEHSRNERRFLRDVETRIADTCLT